MYYILHMATKKATKRPTVTSWRPNEADYGLLDKLQEKMGLKPSQIIRVGLHRLAESEGLKLKKAS